MKRIGLLTFFALTPLGLTACSDDVTSPAILESQSLEAAGGHSAYKLQPGEMTIAEKAEAEGFTLLLAAVNYIAETNPESGLIAGLLNKDQYTVFAPTDVAFENLVGAVQGLLDPDILAEDGPFAAIDDLLGPGTVEAVVSYHVVEGRRAANSVVPKNRDRQLETLLDGATFRVTNAGQINAVGSSAGIAAPNVSASNGIIHVIDAVLLPVDLGL